MSEKEVLKIWKSDRGDIGKRLDLYLTERCPNLSRTQIQNLIEGDCVQIDGAVKAKANAKVKFGQVIEIHIPAPKKIELLPEDIPLDVLYEDLQIMVINKQPGLVVHPAPGHAQHTLVNAILNHCIQLAQTDNPLRPGIVHRLDKDTSGCLMIAKDDESLRKIGIQFEKRQVTKVYSALVFGRMDAFKGEIELAIGRHPTDRKKMAVTLTGKPAHTTFEVVERFKQATLVNVYLRTGRTHQIRVHMAYLGHPVLGDSEYGKKGGDLSEKLEIGRQMLHAAFLAVKHPKTQERVEFSAPMPLDMKTAMERLRQMS